MELKCGVTGFEGREGPFASPPFSDWKTFHSHCYAAARIVCAKVHSIEDPFEGGKVCNYLLARFDFSDCSVTALLNRVYPILGFAKFPAEVGFIDCPKLAEAFASLGDYTVASGEELNRPLLRELCKDLAPRELKQIQYFRPRTIGDVIFNYWD
jgi:hypothetical protein